MFDPVLKDIADEYSADVVGFFQRQLNLPVGGPFEVVQPNLPQGTVEADRVYRLSDPAPMLLHTEWESSAAPDRPGRFLVYNTLLTRQTDLPVQTVVVLLRPQANSTDLTGTLTRTLPTGAEYLVWRYAVIRLWELSPEPMLESPGLTPLAPMCGVVEADLPGLARELIDRWSHLPERQVRELVSATRILMGLRYDVDTIRGLFRRASAMSIKESVVYQEILEEGSVIGELKRARHAVLRVGRKHLGEPDAVVRDAIQSCHDLDRLDRMLDRAVDAPEWAAVLATE